MQRRKSNGRSEALVVPLSGQSARALEAARSFVDSPDPVVFPLARLADGRRSELYGRRYDSLAIVGAPPTDEVGYAFSVLIALLGRPRRVALIDSDRSHMVVKPLLQYLVRSAPLALGQLSGSLAALAAQRVGLAVAKRSSGKGPGLAALQRLVYLRPVVGSGAGVGGSVTHSHEVIRALRVEGVEVDAYTTGAALAETAAREPEPPCRWQIVDVPRLVKAVPASAAAGGDAALVRAALPAARTADVIYQRHTRFSLAGALLARLTAKPLFLEYNGSQRFAGRYWNPTPLQRRLGACEDAALNAASRIFVVSEVDRDSLENRGIGADRIIFNPNGVDATRFATGKGSSVRLRHGIDADAVVIGFVGSFGPWHGAPVLARAFIDIAERVPRSHLLLVGDGPELEETRGLLRDAGLKSAATFTGPVPPHEVPAYLDACDVLASPHVPLPDGVEFFGSPTKLFEYMAAAKPIVASRLGQIGDVLENGATALLVEPGDVRALADAVCALAEDPDLGRELGAKARRQAIERHSWQLNARRVIEAYGAVREHES